MESGAELKRFLASQTDFLRESSFQGFAVERSSRFGNKTYVHFSQTINGLRLPTSRIVVSDKGEVLSLTTLSVDPSSAVVNQANWKSKEALLNSAENAYETRYGEFDRAVVTGVSHEIQYNDTATDLRPVMRFFHGDHQITVDAFTGEVIGIRNSAPEAERHCDVKSGVTNAGDRSCNHPTDVTVFYNNGCIGGSSRCTDSDVLDYRAGFDVGENFVVGGNFTPLTNFDLVLKSIKASYASFRYFGGKYVIQFTDALSAGSPDQRETAATHEWGHGWHRLTNTLGYNYPSYLSYGYRTDKGPFRSRHPR